MDWARILTGYLVVLNLVSFAIMAADKGKAKRGTWRVPERILLGLAAVGGSPGVWLGMYVFRHKTRKRKFSLGVPVLLCLQVSVLVFLSKYL